MRAANRVLRASVILRFAEQSFELKVPYLHTMHIAQIQLFKNSSLATAAVIISILEKYHLQYGDNEKTCCKMNCSMC